jgi:hypothetical protein
LPFAAAIASRLAALPRRYLDDAGVTVGERAAILRYGESTHDPRALIVATRL